MLDVWKRGRPRLLPDFSQEKRVPRCSISFPLQYEAEGGYSDSPKYLNIYLFIDDLPTLYELYETVRYFALT